MAKNIYLQAGNSNVKMSVVELLREAADKVENIGDVGLVSLYLQPRYAKEDNEYIDMEFYALRKSDIKLRKDSVDLMHDERYTDPSIFSQEAVLHKAVKLLEVWNSPERSQIDKVSDIATLLSRAAVELEKLGIVEVLDIIMHDSVDGDALNRPYIRIYYAVK